MDCLRFLFVKLAATISPAISFEMRLSSVMGLAPFFGKQGHGMVTGYPTGGQHCCNLVRDAGLENVFSPNSSIYPDRVESYWSLTAQLDPACFVMPTSSYEVAAAVKALTKDPGCQFAVRSGGHSSVRGYNNIENGVTLDLGLLNHTVYDSDTELASIGPGSRWLGVYQVLDQSGVGVPGGRLAPVGVGGLLTGGGCSLYMFREGFAMDSVHEYEVVLANGTIVVANAGSPDHADLFQVLKGGGNNFGIVTEFRMSTFPTNPIWSMSRVYEDEDSQGLVPGLIKWIDEVEDYQSTSTIVFWAYMPANERILAYSSLSDVSGTEASPVFDDLMAVPGAIEETSRFANMSTMAASATQADGYRNIWFTITLLPTPEIINHALKTHRKLVSSLLSDEYNPTFEGQFETQCFFNPLPYVVAEHGRSHNPPNGNILGLEDSLDGRNAVILLGSLAVRDTDEEERIGRDMMRSWREEMERFAKEQEGGGDMGYRYMNYADGEQDVLAAYGRESLEKIKKVAREYDPEGVWQRQVPGGHKILG